MEVDYSNELTAFAGTLHKVGLISNEKHMTRLLSFELYLSLREYWLYFCEGKFYLKSKRRYYK